MKSNLSLVGTTFAVKDNPHLANTPPAGCVSFVRNTSFDKPDDPPSTRGVQCLDLGVVPLGWLGKGTKEQARANELIDAGELLCGTITECDYSGKKPWCEIEVDWMAEEKKNVELLISGEDGYGKWRLMQSFNEPSVFVKFYEEKHLYRKLDDGLKFTSVTRLKSKLFKEFDKEAVSARCANAWGMKQDDVKTMWDNNGTATSLIGSGIHLMMENFIRFGERGLTKMPVLRSIVTSFPWGDYKGCKLYPEVLITNVERRICGLCDLLVELPDGSYRVEDYKVNHAPHEKKVEFADGVDLDLPNNKFSEYCVQLSSYGEMLEIAGLSVCDKIVIHTWNGEGSWSHHPMKRVGGMLDRCFQRYV